MKKKIDINKDRIKYKETITCRTKDSSLYIFNVVINTSYVVADIFSRIKPSLNRL